MPFVNVLSPKQLVTEQVITEYKDIAMIFAKVISFQQNGRSLWSLPIPCSYTLNQTCHEAFFYDKVGYLLNRYQELFMELGDRGLTVDWLQYKTNMKATDIILDQWRGDWTPTPEDILINMVHIAGGLKPHGRF